QYRLQVDLVHAPVPAVSVREPLVRGYAAGAGLRAIGAADTVGSRSPRTRRTSLRISQAVKMQQAIS
ncbi:MAG TPA: hypothetical protein VGK33_23230, partial [Chloroflexota bacterium]